LSARPDMSVCPLGSDSPNVQRVVSDPQGLVVTPTILTVTRDSGGGGGGGGSGRRLAGHYREAYQAFYASTE